VSKEDSIIELQAFQPASNTLQCVVVGRLIPARSLGSYEQTDGRAPVRMYLCSVLCG
jgi:hypothetical protein